MNLLFLFLFFFSTEITVSLHNYSLSFQHSAVQEKILECSYVGKQAENAEEATHRKIVFCLGNVCKVIA